MKKFITLLLTLAMLVSMTVWGGGVAFAAGEDEKEPEETAEPVKDETKENKGKADKGKEDKEEEEELVPFTLEDYKDMFSSGASIEETVLLDDYDVVITATGLEINNYYVELKLTIENNTDQDLKFRLEESAINGYMQDEAYLYTDVAAGKKAKDSLKFDVDELALMGITEVAVIDLTFSAKDKDYDDYFVADPVRLETSIAGTYEQPEKSFLRAISSKFMMEEAFAYSVDYLSQKEVFSAEDIRIISETLIESDGERTLFLEVENTGKDPRVAAIGYVSVNGLLLYDSAWTSSLIYPGARYIASLSLTKIIESDYWEVYGLEEICEISFFVQVGDGDWEALTELEPAETVVVSEKTPTFDDSGEVLYDEDGIRIVFKQLVPDSSSYSDDIYALLLVTNETNVPLNFSVAYSTLYINGFQNSFWCRNMDVTPGTASILEVELYESSLEENDISDIADIEEIELTFDIRDENYKSVAKPTATITF